MGREEVVIVPYRDGPYLVRGPALLHDQDGMEIETSRRTIALCRCGRSRIRPFCDGSHQLTRFRAPSGRESQPEDGRAHPSRTGPTGPPADIATAAAILRSLGGAERQLARLLEKPSTPSSAPGLAEAATLIAAAAERLRAVASEDPTVQGPR